MPALPTGVELHRQNIRIWFLYKGKRCREVLQGWSATPSNLKKAGNLRARIVSDIQLGNFDYLAYFPESKTAKSFQTTKSVLTFGELAKLWFEGHKITLSPNAVRSYGISIRMLEILIVPSTLLSDINNNDILVWRKELLCGETHYQPSRRSNKQGRAVRTVEYYLAILRQILEFGYLNKYITHRPFDGIKRLHRNRVKPDPFLQSEYQIFRETAPVKQKNMWQVAFYTGVRPGELCGLAWEDVDLEKGEIHIHRNLTQQGIFGPPKTRAGERTIKLLAPALEALKAQYVLTGHFPKVPVEISQREFGKSEIHQLHFVFMPRKAKGEQASHYSVNSISSLWNTTIRLSGVRRRRPYQTRHTYACWMLSAGANPAFIANQMGHENAEMVYTVYSAWINALDGDQIAFLNQRIGGYSSVPQVPPEVDAL